MEKKEKSDILYNNYDKLNEDEKDKLLTIGERLLDIQNVINSEKLPIIETGEGNNKKCRE